MEMTLSNGFCEMNEKEIMCVDGGGAVAAVYALGFVFGYCRRISRRSLFRAQSVAPPKQCKGRHKSGPAPVRSVQSIDFLSTITGFVFQFFDKQMIAYGFVPVGGPGPA